MHVMHAGVCAMYRNMEDVCVMPALLRDSRLHEVYDTNAAFLPLSLPTDHTSIHAYIHISRRVTRLLPAKYLISCIEHRQQECMRV